MHAKWALPIPSCIKKRSDMRRFQRGWSWLGSVMRTCIIAFVESYYQKEREPGWHSLMPSWQKDDDVPRRSSQPDGPAKSGGISSIGTSLGEGSVKGERWFHFPVETIAEGRWTMGDENPTGICKPQILRNTSYIVTSEEVFVEGVVMIIFPKEKKFLYDHHRKGDEPWRKIPTGICKARRHLHR